MRLPSPLCFAVGAFATARSLPAAPLMQLASIYTLVLLLGPAPAMGEDAPSELLFEKHVRPILKTHCFLCHGEEEDIAGGLDLRLVRLMRSGGDSGEAITDGAASDSLLVDRVLSDEMPPGPKKLNQKEKDTIVQWVAQGARTARPEPDDPEQARFTQEELSHWAFQPVAPIAPPRAAAASAWASLPEISPTDTDAFIGRQLADQGLQFAPPADRSTLIRRLKIDLLGLPPTPAEVTAFVNDPSPHAYERLVDAYLASPQYGVRWGRYWLDAMGYAESDGNLSKDQPRPHAWHYRDYVIDALNRDLPYDQFLIEQLAGDELLGGVADPNNVEHVRLLAATGMLRMAPDVTQTNNTLLDRNQAVSDMMNVVGTAVLGLSVGCAQCHDHRYDPISTEDYYRLRAIFDPAFPLHQWKRPQERLVDLTDDATRAASAEIEARAAAKQEDIVKRRREHCEGIQTREIEKVPEDVRESVRVAVKTPKAERTPEQTALLERFPKVRSVDWIIGQLVEYDNPTFQKFEAEFKEVEAIRETKPLARLVMAVAESRDQVPESKVFFRGSPESPTKTVQPGELTVLTQQRPHVQIPPLSPESTNTTGRRLAYARQLTDGTHPTVARVIVNRVWLHHFGRGLVATPGEFGFDGDRPSHLELLDFLAAQFVDDGWSLKRLHKRLLMSHTYQQSSIPTDPRSYEIDPENVLLSHHSLQRLDAEVIRDAILAASNSLDPTLGGPSVPVAEDGEGKAVIGKRVLRNGLFQRIDEVGPLANRRSVFISTQRSLRLNLLETFDLPEMNPNCLQRDQSTVASQALLFLNDDFLGKQSAAFASHLFGLSDQPEEQVRHAFLTCYATLPSEQTVDDTVAYLTAQAEQFRAQQDAEWKKQLAANPRLADERALASLCQVMFASNGFLYVE